MWTGTSASLPLQAAARLNRPVTAGCRDSGDNVDETSSVRLWVGPSLVFHIKEGGALAPPQAP